MPSSEGPDYAALIRAAHHARTQPPDWLSSGSTVFSPQHGLGEVTALLGQRLAVNFRKGLSVQYPNWETAIAAGQIRSADTEPSPKTEEDGQEFSTIDPAALEAIPQESFRSIARELSARLVAVDVEPPHSGEHLAISEDLPSAFQVALGAVGINRLYSHQVESLQQLRSGRDLSIVTPTASGKTLCYNPAIFESCLTDPSATALYLFPLKALALDQMRKLENLVGALPPDRQFKVGLMTGDTPTHEREKLFDPDPPRILAMSPDLLHYQLHKVKQRQRFRSWRNYLRYLRWVVVDEVHTYIGAFGAHFANLMRRLRLTVDQLGGDSDHLQFVFSSATVGNPAEMALRFSGRERNPERLHLIERS